MAVTTQVVFVGNLVRDPELKKTSTDKSLASFTLAATPSKYNQTTKKFEDGETVFMRCTAWDDTAEHVAHSLSKGDRVIAVGTLKASKYKDREGNDKTSTDLHIEEVGPSLRFANAQPRKGDHSYTNQINKADDDGWVTVDDDTTPF